MIYQHRLVLVLLLFTVLVITSCGKDKQRAAADNASYVAGDGEILNGDHDSSAMASSGSSSSHPEPSVADIHDAKIPAEEKFRKLIEYYRSRGVILRTDEEREADRLAAEEAAKSSTPSKEERIQRLYERLRNEGVEITGLHPEAASIMVEGMDTLSAAQYLYEQGFYDYALQYAEKAVARNPGSFDALLLKSRLLPSDREGEKEDGYRRLVEMDPTSIDALVGLGAVLVHRNPSEGISYAEKALQIDPSHGLAYHTLGECYERLGRYDEALNAFHKAHQIAGGSYTMAHILRIQEGNPIFKPIDSESREQQPDGALLEQPSRDVPPLETTSAPLLTEGVQRKSAPELIQERNQPQGDAGTQYQRLMQEDPEGLSRAHYEYAREMLKAGRLEEAAEDLHRAIELNPQHTDSYRELAGVYERMEEYERAATVYQQALKQFPEDERLRRDWEAFRDKRLREEAPKRPEPEKQR